MAKDYIKARVAELQDEHRARHDVTIDSLTADLADDRKLAHRVGQAGAAVSATMGKAKLHGLDVNKHEIASETEINLNVTVAEKARAIAASLAKAVNETDT